MGGGGGGSFSFVCRRLGGGYAILSWKISERVLKGAWMFIVRNTVF